ncbi:MAG: RNA-binding domain-containing protein [Candidatus Methanofastidiosia archaeon]
MRIEIKTTIYPTEDEEKIMSALKNIFPKIGFNRKENTVMGFSNNLEDLAVLKELIAKQGIRDTARHVLKENKTKNTITFSLNKQVATVGKVNFSNDCPMGPIRVRVSGDVGAICDFLAPSTVE